MQTKSMSCIDDELRMLEKLLKGEVNSKMSEFMHEFLKSQTKFFQSFEMEMTSSRVLSPQLSSLDD